MAEGPEGEKKNNNKGRNQRKKSFCCRCYCFCCCGFSSVRNIPEILILINENKKVLCLNQFV